MTDAAAMFQRALDHFSELVHSVAPGDWTRATPCAEWNVRDLVNHLVAEQLWVPPLIDGQTVAEMGDRFDGDVLGADPVRAWDDAAGPAAAAFQGADLQRTVHLSYADVPAEEYCWQMTMDLLIHGWDLARGIGADETMDPELVDEVHRRVLPMAGDLAASGMFAPPVDTADDDVPAVRLLALFGRRG